MISLRCNILLWPQVWEKIFCSKDLIYNISKAASTEVRAKHNDFVKRGIFTDHTGLSCFSPVVNIMRHPLWGRNQVTAWSHISLLNCTILFISYQVNRDGKQIKSEWLHIFYKRKYFSRIYQNRVMCKRRNCKAWIDFKKNREGAVAAFLHPTTWLHIGDNCYN